MFVLMALHICREERKFKKKEKTTEQYEEYTTTNVHSLRFSIYTSIVILIPVGGVVLAIVVAIESIYQGLIMGIDAFWDVINQFISNFQ